MRKSAVCFACCPASFYNSRRSNTNEIANPMAEATLNRACPVCGARDSVPHWKKGDLTLVQCRNCSMVFASPVPAEMASGEFYDREAAGYYLSPSKLESDYAPVRFERELRIFRKHCAGGKVLDVGCSSGAFLYQLQQRFPGQYAFTGMDASGPALEYAASRGVPVLQGNFLEHSFGDERFDAITFWAVLEHLQEPRAFVEKAAQLLKPGGNSFLLVPNFQSLAHRSLGPKYRYVYAQHLNYFTRKTVERMLPKELSVVECATTHFNPIILWQDWRRGGTEVSNVERGELLKRTTAYKQKPWLAPVRWGYRATESILGAFGLADNLVLVLSSK
jgi:2-polyprenyl-3-methyl-5-hydroxy-6-metoxy-1,4-benzoquinol methylase